AAADPNVETLMASCGGMSSFMGSSTTGRMWVQLLPRRQRELGVSQVIERMRPKIARFPGIRVYPSAPQSIRVGGFGSKSNYQFVLQGQDTETLYPQAQKFELELAKLPELRDVSSDLQIRDPMVSVVIDRKKAASLQLDARTIESGLYDMYGPSWVSTMYLPNSQNRVLLELLPKFQESSDW